MCSAICPMGHFCPLGSAAPIPCPAGMSAASNLCTIIHMQINHIQRNCFWTNDCEQYAGVFGNVTGLTDASCSTECWLAKGGPDAVEDIEAINTAGESRAAPDSVCFPGPNLCYAGFYCPEGSISGDQIECGNPGSSEICSSVIPAIFTNKCCFLYSFRPSIALYCPEGSAFPKAVSRGFYSIPVFEGKEGPSAHQGRRQIDQRICPL
jgi:hypothetical protein